MIDESLAGVSLSGEGHTSLVEHLSTCATCPGVSQRAQHRVYRGAQRSFSLEVTFQPVNSQGTAALRRSGGKRAGVILARDTGQCDSTACNSRTGCFLLYHSRVSLVGSGRGSSWQPPPRAPCMLSLLKSRQAGSSCGCGHRCGGG